MANTPIESIEAEQPLLIERYGFVPDTGGAGKYRGGLGIVREFRLLADEAMVQIRSDRTKFLPWGVRGGKPGTRTWSIVNPDTENRILPSKFLIWLKKNDVYRLIQAGAGGYGSPMERNPEAVLNDVLEEKLTIEYARKEYGVVIDPQTLTLDVAATDKLRTQMKKRGGTHALQVVTTGESRGDEAPPHFPRLD